MRAPTRTHAALAVLVVLALAAVAMLVAVLAPRGEDGPPLEQHVREFTGQLSPRGPYRPPEPAERDAVLGAVASLLQAGPAEGDPARRTLEEAGFTVGLAANASGEEFLVARSDPASERSWGLIALPLDREPRLLVEVPHPNSDYGTEEVGLAVLAARPDAIYLQAGAHRRAADESADVAHEVGSLFHALAVDLSVRLRLPQLQLHGFGERDDLDDDVVLGGGPEDPAPAVRDLADRLEEADLSVCRAWSRRCRGLEGTTNVQGHAASLFGLPFAHVEMSADLRKRPEDVAPALATMGG
ncbi:hypothetical protein [Pseudonocardia kunmingensis]|uniref:Uncharacterized protein n=1 Tax=Pseudonocardia kunmingensis TaxID=630975 RepID=A0A543D9G7_9PSEU|nr:hypothetical protein [Pseudonocardia kunmingensis]TQM05935.1 hypothetical protein FB558_6159 [Pseudonocardia kunmingensis]